MIRFPGIIIDKKAGDKQWGFTALSEPRFVPGSERGVLVCHGFGGTPANMRCLVDAAAEQGCTVEAPLLTGHASTLADMERAGSRIWQADVDAAFEKLVSNGCTGICLCGLSMGALLMADLAARRCADRRIKGVVLICPPLKMRPYLNISSRFAGLIPYVLTSESFKPDPDMEMYYGMATRKLADIRRLAKAVGDTASRIKAPVLLVEAGLDNRVHPSTYPILEEELGLSGHTVFPEAPHGIPYSENREELAELFGAFLRQNV